MCVYIYIYIYKQTLGHIYDWVNFAVQQKLIECFKSTVIKIFLNKILKSLAGPLTLTLTLTLTLRCLTALGLNVRVQGDLAGRLAQLWFDR